ncbi:MULTISPECIES: thermonuclease family protein [unclassified Sinorhizobium]|uniref:thermonuclease family protein n=1 Tax=unclassified Sinorhizobium TaxID=2613772 RepID=UPI00352406C8
MAKAAGGAGRRRKSSGNHRSRKQGASIVPWTMVALLVVGGIVIHDNWKRIRTALPELTQKVSSKPSPGQAIQPQTARAQTNGSQTGGGQTVGTKAGERPVALAPATPPMPVPAVKTVSLSQTTSAAFGFCGEGPHTNCVLDGDTFWLKGVKIKIADIETPELSSPRCEDERRLGTAAKVRLLNLLNAGPFVLRPADRDDDKDGPKLRVVSREGRSIGQQLVADGLARPWSGPRKPWCA